MAPISASAHSDIQASFAISPSAMELQKICLMFALLMARALKANVSAQLVLPVRIANMQFVMDYLDQMLVLVTEFVLPRNSAAALMDILVPIAILRVAKMLSLLRQVFAMAMESVCSLKLVAAILVGVGTTASTRHVTTCPLYFLLSAITEVFVPT